MSTKLNRGNSLGLRLPQHIVEHAALEAGDYLYVRLLDPGEIMICAVKAHNVPLEYGVGPHGQQLPTKPEPELEW